VGVWGYGRMRAMQHATRNTHHPYGSRNTQHASPLRITQHATRFTFYVSRLALPALLLLAFALRVHALDFQPLWFDEGKSVFFANQEAWQTALLTAEDIHPPLYYYLLHIWALMAEWSPFALRFLSASLSLLTVPLVYQLGRLLSGRRLVGLLAALLLTLSPMHVYYAQEARMYALVTTLGLASTVLMLRVLETPSQRWLSRHWVVYLVITTAALYTHYYAAFIPLFQTAFVLLCAWRTRRYRHVLARWVGGMALLGLAYAPWLYLSYEVLTSYVVEKVAHEAYPPLPPWEYLTDHLTAFSAGALGDRTAPTIVCVALALLGLLSCRKSQISTPKPQTDLPPASCILHPASCLLLYLFVPLAAGFAINLYFPFHPPHYERQFLYAAPAFYVLVAFGLVGLVDWTRRVATRRRREPMPAVARWAVRVAPIAIVALTLLVIAALSGMALQSFYTTARYAADDYRPLIELTRALGQPDDVVVCIYPWQVGYFQSYLSPPRPVLYFVPVPAWSDDVAQMEEDLDALLDAYPRLWFPSYQVAGRVLETRVETYLSKQAHIIEQGWEENNKLLFYASPRPLPAPAPGAQFGDPSAGSGQVAVVLDEYQMATTTGELQSAWGVVRVRLNWHLLKRTMERLLVTLRLADANGNTWALSDSEPQAGLWPFALWGTGERFDDRRALLIPAGTPPGAYNLYLSLHRAEGGQPLPVTGSDGTGRGTELLLGQVNVVAAQKPPPIQALPIQHPRQADFGDVRLLGYSIGAGPLRAGQPAPVTLFWQARQAPSGDYMLAVELRDEAGRTRAQSAPRLLGDQYPTSRWYAGEFVVDRYRVMPAAGVSGAFRLTVAVYNAAGQPVGEPVALQPVLVTGRAPSFAVPDIQYPMDVRFGESVSLLGYQIEPSPGGSGSGQHVWARPGQTIALTLYWKCLAPLGLSYKVFTHLIEPDQPMNIWAQDDDVPGHGTAPTTGWVVGEVLTDTYSLTVKPETPPGTYYLNVGLYDPVTGARLPAFDAAGNPMGDHVLLRAVQVGEPYP